MKKGAALAGRRFLGRRRRRRLHAVVELRVHLLQPLHLELQRRLARLCSLRAVGLLLGGGAKHALRRARRAARVGRALLRAAHLLARGAELLRVAREQLALCLLYTSPSPRD